MLEKYPNLYADISYTLNNPEFFPLLKILLSDPQIKNQILFGSDYYMVEYKATERRFGIDLRGYLGEENFKVISYDNPRRFMKIS
jgi:predicted TIM-barrel fold metal-dependent hydrolase